MEQVYFSASMGGFIPAAWRDDGTYNDETWSQDAVLLTDDEAAKFWKQNPPDGKTLGSIDGRPAWVAIPVIIESLPVRLSKLSTIYKADISALNESYLSALVNDGINETAKLQVVRDQIVERKAQYIADIAAAKAAHK